MVSVKFDVVCHSKEHWLTEVTNILERCYSHKDTIRIGFEYLDLRMFSSGTPNLEEELGKLQGGGKRSEAPKKSAKKSAKEAGKSGKKREKSAKKSAQSQILVIFEKIEN